MTPKKYVYAFGTGWRGTEGDASLRAILGGKGAGLAEMAIAGFAVPPGFTISAEAGAYYAKTHGAFPPGLLDEVRDHLRRLEERTGARFGDARDPLLVSVRPGAAVAQPGLMDSLLNLGLTDRTVPGLARRTGSPRAGWDCYRRLVARFGERVAGPPGLTRGDFDAEWTKLAKKYGVRRETDLTAEQLRELFEAYRRVYFERTGKPFPQDPFEQVRLAIGAVFRSWDAARSRAPRPAAGPAGFLGPAVNVCAMVFGNLGPSSGAGLACSRDPQTGEAAPVGRYLINAQGDDLPDGPRRPKDLADMPGETDPAWKDVHGQLLEALGRLERYYRHPQEVEFTVERGRLWLLQSRPARGTPVAAARWAVEMATGRDAVSGRPQERLLRPEQALAALTAADLDGLLGAVEPADGARRAPRAGASPGRAGPARPPVPRLYRQLSEWADRARRVQVRAAVADAAGVPAALALGADGFGVLRLAPPPAGPREPGGPMAAYLAARETPVRERAAERLVAAWRAPLEKLLAAARGAPVALRLAPPPAAGLDPAAWWGLQAQAAAEAAARAERKRLAPAVELLAPVRTAAGGFEACAEAVRRAAEAALRGRGSRVRLAFGAFVETPRAALLAGALAESADLLVFDTGELTRLVFGCEAEPPPEAFDAPGVGHLVDLAVRAARDARPGIPCGLDGPQAADPSALRFCGRAGLAFVTCPPPRVAGARLAAAHAAIRG